MSQNDNKFQKVEWSGDQYSPADDDLDELPAPPWVDMSGDISSSGASAGLKSECW